ncbi:MAG TPA: alkaline phosphatase family protein [Planctomycetota bacterium]|nr:alkaline phosphatase family protein [Planctomycetota bacterium]
MCRVAQCLFGLALLGVLAPEVSAGEPAYKTRNVLIVSMDGVRFSETFGDPKRELIPSLAKLEKDGTLYTTCYNTGVTITRQGHSTIATGTWQNVPLAGPRQTMPSLSEYARNELGWAKKDAWVVFGKGFYSYAAYGSFPTYGEKFAPSFVINIGENNNADDAKVLAQCLKVIDTDKPRMVFINFGTTDHTGHSNKWEVYTDAIRNCDQMIAKLWDKVQSTPGYKDETTLFFTTDHGRHNDKKDQLQGGFASHGDRCEGCQHIWLLVVGPDSKRGAVIDHRILQVDIAPTVAELLGFQTPLAEGSVLGDCLVECLKLNQKQAKTPEAEKGLALRKLAERDLLKAIADATLQRTVADLKPDAGVALLMRGMLRAAEATKDTRYRDFVQAWVKEHAKEGAENPNIARVAAELSGKGEPAAKAALGLERATEQDLIREWQKLGVKPPPMACEGMPKQRGKVEQATAAECQGFLGLLDAAAATPDDRIVRLALDLQQSACSRGLREIGAVWDDPTVSALNLYAVLRARQIRRAKPLQWVQAPAEPAKGKAARRPAGPAWANPEQFYSGCFPYSYDLLKYKVDEKGHYGDGSPMADGAALLLFAEAKGVPMPPSLGPTQVQAAAALPPITKGCVRVILEFGWGDQLTTWKGGVAVEKGKLVALLPYLFEANDKLDEANRTFVCTTMKMTDGLALDIEGTDETAVTMTATPKGISFTLGDLKAKQTIEAKAEGNNAVRATIGK